MFRKLLHHDPIIRRVSLAACFDRFGNGLLISVLAIYFSFVENIGPTKTALALSIGAAVGLLFSVPAGHVVDRVGQKRVVVLAMLANSFSIFALIFVHSFQWLVICFALDSISNVFSRNGQLTLIARVGTPETSASYRAYTRSINNLGIGLGTLGAGIALAVNSASGYRIAIFIDALTFLLGALIYTTVPNFVPTLQKRESFDWSIFKDVRYIAATAMAGTMNIQFAVQNIGIPIWIVKYTNAPRWWVSALLLMNTAAIVLFQMRVSRRNRPLEESARQYFITGVFVAAACISYAFADGQSAKVASAILAVGMAFHIACELFAAMIHWQLSFDLADPARQGAYYGIWTFGNGLSDIIGPSLVTFLLITYEKWGWAILALIFIGNASLFRRLIPIK